MKLPFTLPRGLVTLKARVAIGMAVLLIGVAAVLLPLQLAQTRASMAEMVSAQQTTLVTRTAEEIDDKFAVRRNALQASAEDAARRMRQTPETPPADFLRMPVLATLFDYIFVIGTDGRVRASSMAGTLNLDVSRREYFTATMKAGRGLVSAPYRGLATGRPYVMMTAPIRAADGHIIAMLSGAIDLLKPNFLGAIGATPVGKSGYFYIFARGEAPAVVSHPNAELILGPVRGRSADNQALRALAGFEGTAEGVNSSGIRGLMSFKRLREADWVLAAVLPANEAFAPIDRSLQKTRIGGTLAILGVALIAWLFVRRALKPLDALRENVRQRIVDPAAPELPVQGRDELGDLTLDFNTLMAAQAAAKAALAENEERLRTITDNLPVLIGYVGRDLRYRFANHTYAEWFGVRDEELIGMHMRDVSGAAVYTQSQRDIEQALQGYTVTREREQLINGRRRHVEATYLPHYGPDQRVLGLYILETDITDHVQAQERLQYLAHHDALTGLINRAAFHQRLRETIARAARSRKSAALMYLDIDKFKQINDTRGHGIGDALLRQFAARLTQAVRQTDVVGRFGGDEFVILAEDLGSSEDAALIAQKIVDAMRMPFDLGDTPLPVTTSIGVALHVPGPTGEEAAAVLLERADTALYEAKGAGRNTWRMARASLTAAA